MKRLILALAIWTGMATVAAAQACIEYGTNGMDRIPGQIIVTYDADFSDHDHFSSRGVRLTTAASVLQQDRANVHKFGKSTPFDVRDGFFTSLARRQLLGGAQVTSYCHTPPEVVRKRIVNSSTAGQVIFFQRYDGGYTALVDLAG